MTISTGWRERRLGDLFKIKHGYAFEGRYFTTSGSFVLLTPGNFHEKGGFKGKDGKEKYYEGPVPDGYVLNRGDLLIAMTEQAEGLLGSSVLIPESDRYLHNQRLGLVIDLKEAEVDRTFLYYLFNTRRIREQIRATATGTKVRHTAPSRIYDIRVGIPSVSEQRKLAGILSSYDALIENNTRRIAILEDMARSLYREWFVDCRFPGHEEVAMVDLAVGSKPETWKARRLSDVADVLRVGITPAKFADETFAHYSIPAFDKEGLPSLEKGESIRSSKFLVPDDSVLLSKINPRIPRVWLPFPDPSLRSIGSTEFLVLTAKPQFDSTFLFSLLSADTFRDEFAGRALGTSTSHQRVKPEDVLGMPVVVPTQDLLQAFSDATTPMLRLVHKLRLKSATLRQTRDLLLPKLISGEVQVRAANVSDVEPLEPIVVE